MALLKQPLSTPEEQEIWACISAIDGPFTVKTVMYILEKKAKKVERRVINSFLYKLQRERKLDMEQDTPNALPRWRHPPGQAQAVPGGPLPHSRPAAGHRVDPPVPVPHGGMSDAAVAPPGHSRPPSYPSMLNCHPKNIKYRQQYCLNACQSVFAQARR